MYFLSWILVGAVAGWLAGKILKGNDYGPTMDMGMGIGGAIAGGLLMRSGLGRVKRSNYNHCGCSGWRRRFHSDRRFGERQKDVRSATLAVNRHRTFNCRA